MVYNPFHTAFTVKEHIFSVLGKSSMNVENG